VALGPTLAGVRSIIRASRYGASRVACAFLVYMLSPLPRRSDWRSNLAHPSGRLSLPRNGSRVGLRIVLFEACSAFTRVTACTLALSPYFVTRFTEGFSQLVTSLTAPVAFRLERSPGGACTHWKSAAFSRRTPVAVTRIIPMSRGGAREAEAAELVAKDTHTNSLQSLRNGLYICLQKTTRRGIGPYRRI
jgi:hypothetical protein